MQSLVHADIFFFISTIVLVVMGVLGAVVLFYLIQIARDVHFVVRAARNETEDVLRDLRALRETVREEGLRFRHIVGFFVGRFFRARTRTKKRKAKTAEPELEEEE